MVSAIMVIELQSNKAHGLRITDYIHEKSNTPIFFQNTNIHIHPKEVVKMIKNIKISFDFIKKAKRQRRI
jgi:hypothetical protein